MKPNINATLLAGAALAAASILLGACVTNNNAQIFNCSKVPQTGGDQLVTIKFDAENCPESVDEDGFDVEKNKRIVWQSVGPNNTTPRYEIYFDPFKGSPLKSDSKGNRKSPPFDSCSPAGEYKYTIVGDNCKDKPLDPRFRLR